MPDRPDLHDALAAAVHELGGEDRPGQRAMAEAVADAFSAERHLLVQAGTGTGKSLAYLVPAFLHPERVVIATATLALQHQLVERDIPRLVESLPEGVDTSFAVTKGRSNYACLHRVRAGIPDEQGVLVEAPAGGLGKEVLELRAWAEEQADTGGTGDRDQAPRHTDRGWRQVSVTHRECLGASKCPFGAECFVETAREKAARSHVVVTNHSMLAIDAIENVPMLPDYSTVVVDEAHELTARVTQAASDELSVAEVQRAARRSGKFCSAGEHETLAEAADALEDALAAAPPGRLDVVGDQLREALQLVRDAARAVMSGFAKEGEEVDAARTQVLGWVTEVFNTASRMADKSDKDVLWITEKRERVPAQLTIAPLEVWSEIKDNLLGNKTCVFTSATLTIGGDFRAISASLGLAGDPDEWTSLDVGSPFDYGQQAIVYVAQHLPTPGRDGLGDEALEEIVGLVEAAQGRTLGLFSSRRAAERAAEVVRERLPHLTILAQGDAQLPELARQFVEDPHTCLFGTLSLWQGVDVPGDTCQLVIIDRIPFPRPDDPLMSARQRAADQAGGNGFMQVAATHAALLLAQGAGRLIRTATDRGVVAVLDPRLVTARYGTFLRASLPAMWMTTDPQVVRNALERLAATAQ